MNTVLIEAHPLVRTGIAHLLRTLKGVTGVTVVEPDEGMFDAIETNA
ncbi:DNA-binding response regulator, partial [Francisella tularensis]|nr:DNA-binding response regulator [Francisella tularensis]